ncbi:MAG: hypothetical protein DUD27_00170 [Lachnospiraceae bacterium]|uniref:DUF4190 domain-containing protein n=1 Tax=Candidatus Weimeria bifida TaxID=2599074 RepID=A0A6N7J1A0_9FIRM|nr:hypothetical protein [Candidatus Weimeria bifida]RRF97326.1 MAG: hypothetical protein DUD27_00170 [Lachnospiraceae bacterium]
MKDKKIIFYRLMCFGLGAASYIFIFFSWIVGLISAIASIVFGFLYGKNEKRRDGLVTAGLILSGVYVLVYILVIIIGAAYFSSLKISPFGK